MASYDGNDGNDNLVGSSEDDTLRGFNGNDTLNGVDGNDWLEGGRGNDELYGGAGADSLYGGTGKDILNGEAGNDSLYGGAGNDMLNGGAGNDNLYGEAGADTYVFSKTSGQDEIHNSDTDGSVDTAKFIDLASSGVAAVFQDANDLVLRYGSGGQLTVKDYFYDANYRVDRFQFTNTTWTLADIARRHNGTAGDDSLQAFNGLANTLNGLGGNDNLTGGNGGDALNGGNGNDTLAGNDGNDRLDGGAGNDTLQGNAGADVYAFSKNSGQDRIDNNDTDGSVDTVKFTDFASTGLKAVFQEPGTSDLVFQYGSGGQLTVTNYFYDANSRVDRFQFTNATWTLADIAQRHNGTAGDDTLQAFDKMANTLNGLGGNDSLQGGNGDDSLYGGAGNDSLSGGYGADTLNGGNGEDTLRGEGGADTYVFSKNSGQDVVYNGDTDGSVDKVKFTDLASTGVAAIFQGTGTSDLVLQYGSGGQLTVKDYFYDANSRVDQFQFTNTTTWTLADIAQRHNGTSNNDNLQAFDGLANTLNGLGGADTLAGGNGADTLAGGIDNDTLDGKEGDDTLIGGTGDDTLFGGEGSDTYVFSKGGGQDGINNRDSDDSVDVVKFADVAATDLTGVSLDPNNPQNLVLSYGGGRLTVANQFSNDPDDPVDQFRFAGGNTVTDFAIGTGSGDTLIGGNGNDMLVGLGGADTLRGGRGKDTLMGGNGNDKFAYTSASDTGVTAATRDLIVGFSRAQGDKIDVHALDGNSGAGGQQTWSFVSNFTAPGQIKFDAANHLVLFNQDRDAAAELSIELTGVPALAASDFIFA